MMHKLSIVAELDDYMKSVSVFLAGDEDNFIRYVQNVEKCRLKWVETLNECRRLKASLDASLKDVSTIDNKLSAARRWLDAERQQRKNMEHERNSLMRQLDEVRRILLGDDGRCKLPEEARERLSFLQKNTATSKAEGSAARTAYDRLHTITELDSTVSNLSDTSFSRSEDDLDDSRSRHRSMYNYRKHRQSFPDEMEAKRRKNDGEERKTKQVITTTTLTMKKATPVISATATVETISAAGTDEGSSTDGACTPCFGNGGKTSSAPFTPVAEIPKSVSFTPSAPRAESLESLDEKENCQPSTNGANVAAAFERLNARAHTFIAKSALLPESCLACEKKIRFGRMALKCAECNAITHSECRDRVPLPCVPMGTPVKQGVSGSISDYAPLVPPMIPAIVIHCVNEVEQRGLKEMGIYRIPGVDRDVRALKERFLRGRGAPSLADADIHTVCGCLKDFLRGLREPLIRREDWTRFTAAACEAENKVEALYEAVKALPQPNRDTLAFLILHLQRVGQSTACKMPIGNLATIFGPTVVGYSETDTHDPFVETQMANQVMLELLSLSAAYWSSFIVEPPIVPRTPATLRNTPSTESLLRKTSRRFMMTTPSSRKRFFDTPPSCKK